MAKDATKNQETVILAYESVMPSYGWMVQRFDAANTHLQSIATLVPTFTFAAIVLVNGIQQNPELNFWFVIGLGSAVISLTIALFGRLTGEIRLTNPANLLTGLISLPPDEFRLRRIEHAGESFKDNKTEISRKHVIAVGAIVFFAVETLFLTIWGVKAV